VTLLVGIPVKPFTVAKARLSSTLDAATRSRLGRSIAARTAAVATATGADVRIVTGDHAVAAWADDLGYATLAERPGGGLDGAADAVVTATADDWAVLHADLPLVTIAELHRAFASDRPVVAPTHDGGTSLIKGAGPFRFSYGPGSFRRHLGAMPGAEVVSTPGLALDLDTARDLAVMRRLAPEFDELLGEQTGAVR
jgi:2-phospho-L-lactate guanylyltransferase